MRESPETARLPNARAFILEPRTTSPLPAPPIYTTEMGEESSEILLALQQHQ